MVAILPRGKFGSAESKSVLRAHLALITVVTTVVVSSALLVLFSRPIAYESTASVLVNPIVLSGAVAQPVDMATEKAITSSGAVLSIAGEDLGLQQRDLIDSLSVDVPVDTRILEITASATTAVEARRRAGAIAEAYVAYRAQVYATVAGDQAGDAGSQDPPTGSPANQGAGAEIVSAASLPNGPNRPDPAVVLAAALVAGLALGVGAAVLRDHLDDTVRGVRDLESETGLPVLAVVPNLAPRRWRRLPARGQLASARNTDAYRLLRARTISLLGDSSAKVLLVASAAEPDLARTVATNLAIVAAQARKRVFLLTPTSSAATVFDEVTGADGFLAAGVLAFDSPGSRFVLEKLTDRADLVIIDAPPLLAGADTRTLAEHVDAIVLVEQQGASTHERIKAGLGILEDVPGMVIGAVLVESRKTRVEVEVDPTPAAPRDTEQVDAEAEALPQPDEVLP